MTTSGSHPTSLRRWSEGVDGSCYRCRMGPMLTSRRAVDLVRVGSALCCVTPGCPFAC
ncbi:putative leader peptide [Nakamurella sp. GG22]